MSRRVQTNHAVVVPWGILALILAGLTGICGASSEDALEALLGAGEFTEPELAALDGNGDGKIDVADLVLFSKRNSSVLPGELPGFTWVVAASFAPAKGAGIPMAYPFAIRVEESEKGAVSAVVAELPSFSPEKGLFAQDLSASGERPGQNRDSFAPSQVVPPGTVLHYSDNGDTITLHTDPVDTAADSPRNPTGVALRRAWTISIVKTALFSGEAVHGSISETTSGFLPNAGAAITTEGAVFLAPFVRTDLAPLD